MSSQDEICQPAREMKLCKRGCGRLAACSDVRVYDTCCRGCAIGRPHADSCKAVEVICGECRGTGKSGWFSACQKCQGGGMFIAEDVQSDSQGKKVKWVDHWSSKDDAWKYVIEAQDDPTKPVTFFKYLEIAKDGGLSEITGTKGEDDNLWSPTRYISAFAMLLFLFGNTAYVLYVDLPIVFGTKSLYGINDYLLSKNLMTYLNILLNFVAYMVSSDKQDFFDSPAKLIASVELLILLGLWIRVFWALGQMLLGCCSKGCCPFAARCKRLRWYAVQHLFFNLIPMIGVYSSLLMLFPAAPKVFVQDLFTNLFYRHSNTYYRDLVWLFTSRLICFIIGFDSFLVKFREGANQFIITTEKSDKTELQLSYLVGAAMFLNQILGVVQLNWMIRERLFRFVFAGEDGVMTSNEDVRKETWNAQIARTLFKKYSNPIDKFTMLLTFSDDDFQRLTLHERKKEEDVLSGMISA